MYKMEIRSVIVCTSALVLLLSVFQSTAALTRSSGDKELLRTASVNIDDGGQDAFSVASNKDVSFSLTFPSSEPGSPSLSETLLATLFAGGQKKGQKRLFRLILLKNKLSKTTKTLNFSRNSRLKSLPHLFPPARTGVSQAYKYN